VRRCVNRLLAANVPLFGAVLNDMSPERAGEYYGETDGKQLREYHETKGDSVTAAAG